MVVRVGDLGWDWWCWNGAVWVRSRPGSLSGAIMAEMAARGLVVGERWLLGLG